MNVRQATEADLEQIIALQVDRNGRECDEMIRALVDDPRNGIGCFTVVEANERVVSSMCLLRGTLVLEGTSIGVGQPELVATHADFEHQGLVRAQMDLVHRRSAERGDLVQIIEGIPYFYRRFGYEYAVATPRVRLINPGVKLDVPDDWTVRHATEADVESIMRLEAHTQSRVPLTATRSDRWSRWRIAHDVTGACVVAIHGDDVHGSALLGPGPPGLGDAVETVSTLAADREDAVRALLAYAAERATRAEQANGKPVGFEERTGLARIVDGISHHHPRQYAFYVRVADPVALLRHLMTVLTARLTRSHRAASSGSLLVSTYGSSITITYEGGEVVAIEPGGPHQDPVRHGGIGVPPDLIATLIFGRYGATELAERHPDVRLGPYADLAEILFPRLEADLVLSL